MEQTRAVSSANRAKDTQVFHETRYNILNFQDKLGSIAERPDSVQAPRRTLMPNSAAGRDYNILSNEPFSVHHPAHPSDRPSPAPSEDKPRYLSKFAGVRDYNILTTQYIRDNDEKSIDDEQLRKKEAAVKYWNTHDFDPIRGRFYNDHKELDLQQTRTLQQQEHATGNQFRSRLPPGTRHAPHRVYNLVNGQILDKPRYEAMRKTDAKDGKHVFRGYDDSMQRRAREQEDLIATRSLNRVEPERFAAPQSRGYDIVSTLQYGALHGADVPPPSRVAFKPTVWGTLTQLGAVETPMHLSDEVRAQKVSPRPMTSAAAQRQTSSQSPQKSIAAATPASVSELRPATAPVNSHAVSLTHTRASSGIPPSVAAGSPVPRPTTSASSLLSRPPIRPVTATAGLIQSRSASATPALPAILPSPFEKVKVSVTPVAIPTSQLAQSVHSRSSGGHR
eukprot:TRINITY_DN7645_c0_g1_i1.p1 TRINITY_DN7645_c0_g1~~TRINITY_DN7645_c0_g1_i1.p1  ORF type:complete len:525 (+),score=103.49 TRINITY_DN7645_c0_g1_i1:231-1577(+)